MTLALSSIFDNPSNTFIDLPKKNRNKDSASSAGRYEVFSKEAETGFLISNPVPLSESSHTSITLPFNFNFEYPSYPAPMIDLEMNSSATVAENNDPKEYFLLKSIVNDYLSGEKDIPDLAKMFNVVWTENSIVLLLESLGVYREPFSFEVSKVDEENVLKKLAHIRSSQLKEEYNSESWIRREVIASQRIESVYVFDEDFIE